MFFHHSAPKTRSESALSPIRGRILSNLSCLMKNSASWLPISAVSGCYVRYRGGGAGERRGNCYCMISIITAMDLIQPHILQHTFSAVRFNFSWSLLNVRVQGLASAMGLCNGEAAYVTRGRWWRWHSGKLRRDSSANLGRKRVTNRDVKIKLPITLCRNDQPQKQPSSTRTETIPDIT